MLKNPLRPPPNMQHFLSDGQDSDCGREKGLRRDSNSRSGGPKNWDTAGPDWKWQFLSQISWAAEGKSLFVLAQSASSRTILALDSNGNPRVLDEMPSGTNWVSSTVSSPDGRLLAFARRMFIHDVNLLENS
jgi:hypothetical protein